MGISTGDLQLNDMNDIALFLFDRAGNMAKPWLAVGYLRILDC